MPLTPSYSLISLILDSAFNAIVRNHLRLHITEPARSNRCLLTMQSKQQRLKRDWTREYRSGAAAGERDGRGSWM